MSQSRSPWSDLPLRWYWPYSACARERTVRPMSHAPGRDRRRVAFALLATACVAGGAAYTAWAAPRTRSSTRPGDGGGPVAVEDAAAARTRVSPDGRSRPITVFVSGHSYAASSLSTKSTSLDLTSGAELGNL